MSEPAEKDDIEAAKQALLDRIDALERRNDIKHEGWRQQQSAEHGAIQGSMISMRDSIYWIRDWCKRMFNNDKH